MAQGYNAFLSALRQRESGGDYKIVNSLGYLGAYQFGEAALVDLGFVNRDSNPYDNRFNAGWTGKLDVDSKREFLNDSGAQDAAVRQWMKLIWGYLESVGADDYLGQVVDGITITASGLLAGTHLAGAGNVRDWLRSGGSDDVSDAYGTSLSSYISTFKGYSIPFVDEVLPGKFDSLLASVSAPVATAAEEARDGGAALRLGGGGNDRLSGTRGTDVALGGDGHDTILARRGDDVIGGGAGRDTVRAGGGHDVIDGGGGADRLFGGYGADEIRGGWGRDVLKGGAGRDTLFGGGGADRFVFQRASGADVIRDFRPNGGDVIDFRGLPDIRGWFDLVRNHTSQTAEGLLIEWTGGSVVLSDLTLVDLERGDFLFP